MVELLAFVAVSAVVVTALRLWAAVDDRRTEAQELWAGDLASEPSDVAATAVTTPGHRDVETESLGPAAPPDFEADTVAGFLFGRTRTPAETRAAFEEHLGDVMVRWRGVLAEVGSPGITGEVEARVEVTGVDDPVFGRRAMTAVLHVPSVSLEAFEVGFPVAFAGRLTGVDAAGCVVRVDDGVITDFGSQIPLRPDVADASQPADPLEPAVESRLPGSASPSVTSDQESDPPQGGARWPGALGFGTAFFGLAVTGLAVTDGLTMRSVVVFAAAAVIGALVVALVRRPSASTPAGVFSGLVGGGTIAAGVLALMVAVGFMVFVFWLMSRFSWG